MEGNTELGGDNLPHGNTRPGCLLLDFRFIVSLLGVIVLVLLAGFVFEKVAEARDTQTYFPLGKLVDVGGYRLHLNCSGQGSPTVVIDADGGEWSTLWSWVQPIVSGVTRICTYDRAGYGWSDPGPKPRTSEQIARELHTLLANAGITGPYVLAGHGFGGLNTRQFIHDFPENVAGLVLIDADHVDQETRFPPEIKELQGSTLEAYQIYGLLERVGVVRLAYQPLGLQPPSLPDNLQPVYMASLLRGATFHTAQSELIAFAASTDEVRLSGGLGDLPLIVLSNGLGLLEPNDLPAGFSQNVITETNRVWQELQAELAGLSTHSVHLYAQKSYHDINIEEPQAAVDAILQMVYQVRPK